MPIRHRALELLLLRDPAHKAAAVRAMPLELAGTDCDALIAEPPGVPGWSPRPTLVAPDQLRQRGVGTLQGRVHAGCGPELLESVGNYARTAPCQIHRPAKPAPTKPPRIAPP